MGINEHDLLEIKEIEDRKYFNEKVKHISRKIALGFIKRDGRMDYDLQEMYIIKMYKRLYELDKNSKRDYDSVKKQFQDWVCRAILDLGHPELLLNYDYRPKLLIKKSK